MAEIKINENASRALDQDQMDDVLRVISLCVTWENLGGPSSIEWP